MPLVGATVRLSSPSPRRVEGSLVPTGPIFGRALDYRPAGPGPFPAHGIYCNARGPTIRVHRAARAVQRTCDGPLTVLAFTFPTGRA
jgi:hypothetical protein